MLYRFDNIEINVDQYEIRANGKLLSVEPKVFDLILYLIENRARLISREELFEQVWNGRLVSDTSLSNHIKSARKLLGDSGELQKVIKTVRSRGYQFIATIELQSSEENVKAEASLPLENPSIESNEKTEIHTIRQWSTYAALLLALLFLLAILWNASSSKKSDTLAPHLLVVPFSIASQNAENWEAFSDQITRELIQDLRKISGLTVVPPPSSFAFKLNKVRKHIKTQLPTVNHVLDGVVSEGKNGNLRISVELENIATGELLWNGDFDIQGGYKNLFSIQNDIAASVSKSLQVIILEEEKQTVFQKPTVSLKSYELYAQGQYQLSLMTHESVLNSIRFFNQAIKLDPSFEAAYIAKSKAYRVIMVFFDKPREILPKVISSSIALLTINPESAQIKSSLGLAYVHAWLWEDAWEMLSQAQKKDPKIAVTELGFALFYSAMGSAEGVKMALKKANRLDPLNGEIADWGLWALMMVGEVDEAVRWGNEKLKLKPNMPYLLLGLAIAEYIRENYEISIDLAKKGVNLSHREPLPLIILAQSYAADGQKEKARKLTMEAEQQNSYMCPYETAIVYTLMGENDKVFSLLKLAHEFQSNCLIFARNDPRFESLRHDSRYIELLRSVGLDDDSIRRILP